MRIVDANVVLRYVLDDNEELSGAARQIIDNNDVYLPIEVLCEVVFVLLKVYKAEREDISQQISNFINNTDATVPYKETVLKGLALFSVKNLDFVDCILVGYQIEENAVIDTFDIKLQQVLNRQGGI